MNLLPFEGENIATQELDEELTGDDAIYCGDQKWMLVTTTAKTLCVRTLKLNLREENPEYLTGVERIVNKDDKRKVDPFWKIIDIPHTRKKTEAAAIKDHEDAVAKVLSLYAAHTPVQTFHGERNYDL